MNGILQFIPCGLRIHNDSFKPQARQLRDLVVRFGSVSSVFQPLSQPSQASDREKIVNPP